MNHTGGIRFHQNRSIIVACLAELTLGYRGWGVGAIRQLVGLEAGHGRGWESTRDEVVKRHQLTSSSLLPPTGSSVAEPHLQIKKKKDRSV